MYPKKVIQKSIFFLSLLLFCGSSSFAQNKYKYEREHRIKKSQFPEKALDLIEKKLLEARRIRFYRETDSTKTSFEAKFKQDRLKYSVEFDEEGTLEDVEIVIKPVDIPDDAFSRMNEYLTDNFVKYRIRKIQQQYPVGDEEVDTTFRNAFQNLMLPGIKYEIMVSGKKEKGFHKFEIRFDAEGNFSKIRKSLPPNYDHVLY